jgi:hypothetical protein
MKGKMSKDKKFRRVFEYKNCTRVLGLPSEYSSTWLFVAIPIEYSWKSGKCMNKFKKEKREKKTPLGNQKIDNLLMSNWDICIGKL